MTLYGELSWVWFLLALGALQTDSLAGEWAQTQGIIQIALIIFRRPLHNIIRDASICQDFCVSVCVSEHVT